MTVTFDQVTENVAAADPQNFTHTPIGTPRGVVVLIAHNTISTDIVNGVTYGGVAMSRIRTDADTAGEPGRTYLYFLGASIPTGAQTVSIDRTQATQSVVAYAATFTAAADTEVIDHDGTNGDQANPAVTFTQSGRSAVSVGILHSGLNLPANAAELADQTRLGDHDYGNQVVVASRRTTADTADDTFGYTSASEDVALSAAAIAEVVAAGTDLVVQDAAHAHAADNIVLTQVHVLTVADALHGHAADNLALTQVHNLVVADAFHAHSADNLTITVVTDLVVQDASHGHAADNVVLTQAHNLAVQDALHVHAADSLALTQVHNLVVADALHAHSAENVVLTTAGILVVQDALHAHTADNLALTQVHELVVQDALHVHLADNVVLVLPDAAVDLEVQDALHEHIAEHLTLIEHAPIVFRMSEPVVVRRGDMFPSIGRNKRRPYRHFRRR